MLHLGAFDALSRALGRIWDILCNLLYFVKLRSTMNCQYLVFRLARKPSPASSLTFSLNVLETKLYISISVIVLFTAFICGKPWSYCHLLGRWLLLQFNRQEQTCLLWPTVKKKRSINKKENAAKSSQ